jgi:hypothetical protein
MSVVEFPAPRQQQLQAKYICSACGADRGCQCNAPAIEKLAQKQEQDRRRAKAYRERKAEENQQSRHVTEEAPAPKAIDEAQASADEMKAKHAAADCPRCGGSGTAKFQLKTCGTGEPIGQPLGVDCPICNPAPARTPTATTSTDAEDVTIEDAEAELKRLKDLKVKLKDNDENKDKFDAQESAKAFAAFQAACSKFLPGMNSDDLQQAINFFADVVEVPANELLPDLSMVQFDLKIAKAEVTALKRKIAGKLPPRESRAAAWSRLTSEATDAINQLIEYQSEFEEAEGAQPEGLQDGPFAQKCEAIREIDLASALETLQEAENAEIPLGFGRD